MPGAAALLLFVSAVRADPFALPPGRPTAARLAAAEPGLTINAEVLARYGFTLEGYRKLDAGERDRVDEWIRILESEKRRAEARGTSTGEPKPPTFSGQTQAALDRLRQRAGSPSFFDGRTGGESSPYFTPSLDVMGPGLLRGDGTMTPGGVRRFTLTGRDGLRLEGGTLGLDGRSPLVERSPYLGAGKDASGSTGSVDYDLRAQAYLVGLGARLFTNDNPALDARIDDGVSSLRALNPTIGVDPADIDKIQNGLAFSHDFERQWLFYGSALARAGRAYRLTPRLDVGWSAMGLTRWSGYFPNAATDQTIGARVNPGGGQHVGVFYGVTEALGLFDRTVVAESIEAEKLKTHVHFDGAPHVELAAWGKIPYLSGAEYSVSAGRQWNPWTTLTSVSASAAAPVGGVKLGAFGRYSDETGFNGEFQRQKAAGGLTVSPTPGLDFFGQYQQDTARLGTAQIDNKAVLFGLTLTETAPGPRRGASVTLESLFGGRDQLVSSDAQSGFAQQLQSMLDLLLLLKGASLNAAGGVENGWAAAQNAWSGLSDETRQQLSDAWAEAFPNEPSLAKIFAIGGADLKKLDNVINLLADTQVLERLLVRAVRSALLKKLESVDIPLLGKTRMSAPMVLAAANAYALGLSPLPPVTAADQKTLDAFLLNKLGDKAGCPPGTDDAVTQCLLGKLPADAVAELKKVYGGDLGTLLKNAVDWPSGVLRREINRLALQIMLAAETLNELSVDKGERIADLNVRGLIGSFGRLDERSRRDGREVLHRAAEDLRAELAAQDESLRAELAEYGSARLAWLEAQPAWPAGVTIAVRPEDWPELLAVYGDANLFDLILRCKARLAAAHPAGARLLIRLDRGPLGAVVLTRGDPLVLGLPPRARDLSDVAADL